MACDFNEAVKIIEGLISKTNVNDKKTKLREIVDRINKLASQPSNDTYQRVVQDSTGVELDKEYAGKIKELVRSVNDLVEVPDGELVFKHVSYGIEQYVAGEYDPVKNVIKVAVVPSMEAAVKAATGNAEAKYFKFIEQLNVSDEDLDAYMRNDVVYQKLQKNIPNVVNKLVKVATELLHTEGVHTLTHEYIHAGGAVFMKKHPEHVASKRIKDIFEKVQHKRYAHKFEEAGVSDYWKTNVDEFLAEALSNPKMMVALNSIQLTYSDKLANALQHMVDVIMRMLGFKQNGTAYEFVLDGFAAIIEAQKEQSKIDNGMVMTSDSKLDAGISDTDKQAESKLNNGTISGVIERAGLTDMVDSVAAAELQKLYNELPQVVEFAVNNAKGCY